MNTNGNPQTWGLMPGLDRRFGWKWKWKWHCHRSVSKVGQFSCLCFPSNQLLDCLRSSTYRSRSPGSPIPHYQCWLGRKCIIRTQPSILLPSSQVCCESWTPVAPSSYASHFCVSSKSGLSPWCSHFSLWSFFLGDQSPCRCGTLSWPLAYFTMTLTSCLDDL